MNILIQFTITSKIMPIKIKLMKIQRIIHHPKPKPEPKFNHVDESIK